MYLPCVFIEASILVIPVKQFYDYCCFDIVIDEGYASSRDQAKRIKK